MKIWVLTREINDYNQDGEYFVDVFATKPTEHTLLLRSVPSNAIEHVLTNGGGRIGYEGEWYYLREYERE